MYGDTYCTRTHTKAGDPYWSAPGVRQGSWVRVTPVVVVVRVIAVVSVVAVVTCAVVTVVVVVRILNTTGSTATTESSKTFRHLELESFVSRRIPWLVLPQRWETREEIKTTKKHILYQEPMSTSIHLLHWVQASISSTGFVLQHRNIFGTKFLRPKTRRGTFIQSNGLRVTLIDHSLVCAK